MVHRIAAAGMEFFDPAACRRATDAFWTPSNRRSGIRSISIDRANTSRSRRRRTVPIGFINAFFAVVTGFALIWHIWWMAGLGLIGAFVTFLLFAFRDEEEVTVSVEQIAQFERRHHAEGVVP